MYYLVSRLDGLRLLMSGEIKNEFEKIKWNEEEAVWIDGYELVTKAGMFQGSRNWEWYKYGRKGRLLDWGIIEELLA